MRVLVIGATGATGRVVIEELLRRGHDVVAFARRPGDIPEREGLQTVRGDALVRADVDRGLAGCDAVVVALGISENPLLVRLRRRASRTAVDVRSQGTANVVAAMREAGIARLVVQSTYGAAETRARLSPVWKAIFALVLKPQIEDTERQEDIVRASGLDWTLIRPVSLIEGDRDRHVLRSTDGAAATMKVSYASVAALHADAVEGAYVGTAVAISASPVALATSR